MPSSFYPPGGGSGSDTPAWGDIVGTLSDQGDLNTAITSAVAITGGSIDGTAIGGGTPASGTFSGLLADSLNLGNSSILFSPGPNQLGLRNGTNGQTFAVYASFSDTSNFSRVLLVAPSGGGQVQFQVDEAGSGVGTITGYLFDKPVSIDLPGVAGPTAGGASPPTNPYGTATGNYMGEPAGWLTVNVTGSPVKIPFYT